MSATGVAGVFSEAPTLIIKPVERAGEPVKAKVIDYEQAKYERMWNIPGYRNTAPGEHAAPHFMKIAKPSSGDTVIDFGAGTGRGALMLAVMGMNVTMLDFADNCLDEDVRNCLTTQAHVLRYQHHDLRNPPGVYAKYGYCVDVLEHIPTIDVPEVLQNILTSAQFCYLRISLTDDNFGEHIGEKLHLTVKPFEWWREQLKALDAVISWEHQQDDLAVFYVTTWQGGRTLYDYAVVNTEHEVMKEHISINTKRGLPEAVPHEKTDRKVLILAGGPSMNDYVDEIKAKRAEGYALVTMNNTYNWALDHGLEPSVQLIVDAREHNKRFVERVIPTCRYLFSSQVHPAVFDAVPAEQTVIWHSAISEDICAAIEEAHAGTDQPWYPVIGGSCVMLRALPLLFMLGYSKFDVYGWDSCILDGKHHGYDQPENDNVIEVQAMVGTRSFTCHPWMVSQAQEFLDLMQIMAEHIELQVHGDGLIAHIIQTAADLEDIDVQQAAQQSETM